MSKYTFDAISGFATISEEEHKRLWEDSAVKYGGEEQLIANYDCFDIPLCIHPNQNPSGLVVHDLKQFFGDIHGFRFRYFAYIEDSVDDCETKIWIKDNLALLELVRRYAALITKTQ
ncbi:MAG: hypothetical protein EI684_15325 [Candidatus Viridilinea halotolerans]|uniref:Uncharacterized protein n=1 Tax=Candidatus Viridilinea halotolerans TaxID=2491704 RepID=A0A426TVX9_9CHLR|nr:MAG: hypothetical protein EI684_15325 [Candidatus Viridilinea halotolerans]